MTGGYSRFRKLIPTQAEREREISRSCIALSEVVSQLITMAGVASPLCESLMLYSMATRLTQLTAYNLILDLQSLT